MMRRALALPLLLLASACDDDVTVGENRATASLTGDAGLLAARYDAAAARVVAAGHAACADPSESACDAWLAEIPSGATEPIAVASLTTDARDVARALLLLDDDTALVAGVTSSDGETTAFAARFDGGSFAWENTFRTVAGSEAVAIEPAPSGEIVVVGNEPTPFGTPDGFAARLDTEGQLLGRASLFGTGAANSVLSSVAVNSQNAIFAGGVRFASEDRSGPGLPLVVHLSPELEIWNSRAGLELPGVTSGSVTGIFTDVSHELTMCGSADGQGFVVLMEETLTLIESVMIPGELGDLDVRGCARTDDGGLLLVGADGTAPWVGKVDLATFTLISSERLAPSTLSLWGATGTSGGAAVAVGRDTASGTPIALLVEP